MPAYFARCLRGLEDFCEAELSAIEGLGIKGKRIRSLFFEYTGSPQTLLEVSSLDDVFIHKGSLSEINHTRAMLSEIPERLPALLHDLDKDIELIRKLRDLPQDPSYSLTIGLQGKKNFSRFELQDKILPLFQTRLNGKHILNEKGSEGGDLDFRISLEGNQLELGIRLAEKPLHRREYKLHSRPGSTKAPLAYIMASLAQIEPAHAVLDPCCGVGTILIEASKAFPQAKYTGIDISEESLSSAKANAQLADCRIDFQEGDVRNLSLEAQSIDRIISNPPWGRQVASHLELDRFYKEMYGEWKRLLKIDGKLVVLTDQEEVMANLLKHEADFQEVETYELSLFGSVVKLYLWQKIA